VNEDIVMWYNNSKQTLVPNTSTVLCYLIVDVADCNPSLSLSLSFLFVHLTLHERSFLCLYMSRVIFSIPSSHSHHFSLSFSLSSSSYSFICLSIESTSLCNSLNLSILHSLFLSLFLSLQSLHSLLLPKTSFFLFLTLSLSPSVPISVKMTDMIFVSIQMIDIRYII